MQSRHRRVLVVEDDYFQAQDISAFVRGTGGDVLGPVATLEQGFTYANRADAAVLDIDLRGQPVFPLAQMLMARSVPIVFYSGVSREVGLPRQFWNVPMVRKPVRTLAEAAVVTLSTYSDGEDDDLAHILPKLRLAARLVYSDPAIADRLVERLLEDAIAHLKDGRALSNGNAPADWLMERMRRILRDHGNDLMN